MNSNDALHNINQQEDMDQDDATRFRTIKHRTTQQYRTKRTVHIDWLMNSNDALHNINQKEDMDQNNATRFKNDQAQDDAQY